MKRFSYICFLGMILLSGCNKENDLTATEGEEFHYTVPQGKSDSDPKIVEYYEKYGFCILYDFRQTDMFWNNTGWSGRPDIDGGETAGNAKMKPADTDYVTKHLELIEKAFFNYWPEEYLHYLPTKVLLCSKLFDTFPVSAKDENGVAITLWDTTRLNIFTGYDNIGLNGCSAEIDTLGAKMKMAFQGDVNGYFLRVLLSKGKFEVPQEFIDADDFKYAYKYMAGGQVFFDNGYLNASLVYNNVTQSALNDFSAYLSLAAMPTELLECTPAKIGTSYGAMRNPPLGGCLHPDRDRFGRVRKKYVAMMAYLETCGLPIEVWKNPVHLKD